MIIRRLPRENTNNSEGRQTERSIRVVFNKDSIAGLFTEIRSSKRLFNCTKSQYGAPVISLQHSMI
jgi:hypothetical protein